MIPGEYLLGEDPIMANEGRPIHTLTVVNTGDRPVQVGSHFHFFEVNKQLAFNRKKGLGHRLNIAAGTAVRFEPGEEKTVELVPFGGKQLVYGFSNLVNGETTSGSSQTASMDKAIARNFKNKTS